MYTYSFLKLMLACGFLTVCSQVSYSDKEITFPLIDYTLVSIWYEDITH